MLCHTTRYFNNDHTHTLIHIFTPTQYSTHLARAVQTTVNFIAFVHINWTDKNLFTSIRGMNIFSSKMHDTCNVIFSAARKDHVAVSWRNAMHASHAVHYHPAARNIHIKSAMT